MYLKIQCLFFVSLFIRGSFRYLTGHNTNNSNLVEEIQHAVCEISTKDIQASANATITRQLKGVCTSKELNNRLDHLEKRLFAEINLIKQALGMEKHFSVEPKALENVRGSNDSFDYDYLNTVESIKTVETYSPQTLTYRLLTSNNNEETNIDVNKPSATVKNHQTSYKRDFEAIKYNISIQNTELGKSFLYYWKIYDIQEILTYSDTHIDSPIFYLLGHPMQIKFYPHHLGTHYVALELSNTDNFVVKHRFTILNQNNEKGDVTSQILGINVALFRISDQKLSTGNFTTDGTLIVKLAVALRT